LKENSERLLMRIAIVEDNSVTRETLKAIISSEPSVVLTAALATAEEALKCLAECCPEVLLVDLDLPGMHGIELIRRAKTKYPSLEIMVYTIFEDRETVFSAIKAGASGYILKGSSSRELIDSLESLYRGGAPMSPRIARKVINEFHSQFTEEVNPLSQKESQILRYVGQGMTYKELAELLTISPHTVHTHIKNIYEKLQARDRRDALQRARKIGII
jgi:DNA-binding NarL/FixJ family response regulator